jgi:hypothetical protein
MNEDFNDNRVLTPPIRVEFTDAAGAIWRFLIGVGSYRDTAPSVRRNQ